jgi:serine/threonine protein kinase
MEVSRIGPYRILRELAEDKVGRVFQAVDSTGKKTVLVKRLRPEIVSQPEVISRLYSKAETLALLNHEHIARLFGFISRDDGIYLVIESVQGENLQTFLKEKGRLGIAVSLAYFRQILSAVEFAHRLGVIHGELKPANIVVTDFGRIKVLDFAIWTILGNPDPAGPKPCTARYMSPEQLSGDAIDARSDIYSLGILLHELIVGDPPFTSASPDELAKKRAESTPLAPSLLVPKVPPWLDAFLLRAVALSPAHRFQSVSLMSRALDHALDAEVRKTSPKRGAFRLGRRLERDPYAAAASRNPVEKLRGRLKAALIQRVNPGREKRARSHRGIKRRLEAINPVARCKRGASKLQACARRISSALKPVPIRLSADKASILKLIRQKRASATDFIRRGAAAVDPAHPVKRGRAELRAWARSATKELKLLQGHWRSLSAALTKALNTLSENGVKRYVVIAILLLSLAIETFFFGGVNTLLSPDSNSPPVNSNGVAQTLVDPDADTTPLTASDEKGEPETKIAKPTAKRPRSFDTPIAGVRDAHHQALDSKRTVTYRTPREADTQAQRLYGQEARVTEPSRRGTENNMTKTQLNVTWEN